MRCLSLTVFILIIAAIAIPRLLQPPWAVTGGGNESSAVANIRTIHTAEMTYLSSAGSVYGDLGTLVNAGLLDSRFNDGGTVSGYRFTIQTLERAYTVTATPVSSNTGRFEFYSTPDGVVRYSADPQLGPPGMAGSPIVSGRQGFWYRN